MSASSPEHQPDPPPEPWLRGPLFNVPPAVMPVFFSFKQVREDLQRHVAGLRAEQIWKLMPGGSLGFHLKHLAGSVDRLTTYLFCGQLTAGQLSSLATESSGEEDAAELLALIDSQLSRSEQGLLTLEGPSLFEPRFVGRRRLPTTVFGLLVHLAEHTQRHLGQSITLAHLLRQPG